MIAVGVSAGPSFAASAAHVEAATAVPDFSYIDGAVTTIDDVQLGGDARIAAFAKPGEALALRMAETLNTPAETLVRPSTVTVTDPTGLEVYSHALTGHAGAVFGGTWTSATEGVWLIALTEGADQSGALSPLRVDWNIAVLSGEARAVAGRIFSESWATSQRGPSRMNHEFTAVNQDGARYAVELRDFNGFDASVHMNNVGNAQAGTATPVFRSVPQRNSVEPGGQEFWQPRTRTDHPDLRPYRLFLEPPAADLPESSAAWADQRTTERWILPAYVPAKLSGLSYERTDERGNAGRILGRSSVAGTVTIEIDVDGNGVFDDPADRIDSLTLPKGTAFAYDWNGLDGLGTPVPSDREGITVRATLHSVSPIHFVRADVEHTDGGIRMTQLVGPAVGSDAVSWDDSALVATSAQRYSRTSPVKGDRVSSSAGVHRWAGDDTGQRAPNANDGVHGAWGDMRAVDDWTSLPERAEATVSLVAASPADLRIDKTVIDDPVLSPDGATALVTWGIAIENLGAGSAREVSVTDTYPVGIVPESAQITGGPTTGAFDTSSGLWSVGTLSPGEFASVTFSADVRIDRDRPTTIRNMAVIESPDDPRPPDAACEPNDGLEADTDRCDVTTTEVGPGGPAESPTPTATAEAPVPSPTPTRSPAARERATLPVTGGTAPATAAALWGGVALIVGGLIARGVVRRRSRG